jgi:hypothetical protein
VAVELIAQGNDQSSSGDTRFQLNNYFSQGPWSPTWSCTSGTPDIGNGAIYTEYSRKGKEVTLRVNITMGTSAVYGGPGGIYSWSTPVAAANEAINFPGTVRALCAGAVPIKRQTGWGEARGA